MLRVPLPLDLSVLQLICLAGVSLAGYLVYVLFIYPFYLDPVRDLPGPPSKHILLGNAEDVFQASRLDELVAMQERYGGAMLMRGWAGKSYIHLSDPHALNHVLLHRGYSYEKPPEARRTLERLLGHGILVVEGETHRRQRRIMNAPFSWANVKSYCPEFQLYGNKMVKRIGQLIDEPDKTGTPTRGDYAIIETSGWLGRTTLDLIGRCGFDYDFSQLEEGAADNPLALIFADMLRPLPMTKTMITAMILIAKNPWLAAVPTKMAKKINESMKLMQDEARKMIDSRRKAAEAGELEDKKDLVSILYKASMLSKNPKERLTDDEVMAAITTFTLAGHETSSLTVTWVLRHLADRSDIQAKLRSEIRAAQKQALEEGKEELDADEVMALPYLDAVLRETMRIAPAVTHSERMATEDDVIPLKDPVTGKDGKVITEIPIKKGQYLHISILPFNLREDIFGADAKIFRPERWLEEDLSQRVKGFSTWSPLLSFLGGPRGCIGYRFALAESKILLMKLVESFEFLPRDVGGTPVTRALRVVTRPVVVGEEEKGGQLPLRVRRAV